MAYYWSDIVSKDREINSLVEIRGLIAHRLIRINPQQEMGKREERKGRIAIYKHTNKGDSLVGYVNYEFYSYMNPWFSYGGHPMDINGKLFH